MDSGSLPSRWWAVPCHARHGWQGVRVGGLLLPPLPLGCVGGQKEGGEGGEVPGRHRFRPLVESGLEGPGTGQVEEEEEEEEKASSIFLLCSRRTSLGNLDIFFYELLAWHLLFGVCVLPEVYFCALLGGSLFIASAPEVSGFFHIFYVKVVLGSWDGRPCSVSSRRRRCSGR